MHTFLHRFRYYKSRGYTPEQIAFKLQIGCFNAAIQRERKQLAKQAA